MLPITQQLTCPGSNPRDPFMLGSNGSEPLTERHQVCIARSVSVLPLDGLKLLDAALGGSVQLADGAQVEIQVLRGQIEALRNQVNGFLELHQRNTDILDIF